MIEDLDPAGGRAVGSATTVNNQPPLHSIWAWCEEQNLLARAHHPQLLWCQRPIFSAMTQLLTDRTAAAGRPAAFFCPVIRESFSARICPLSDGRISNPGCSARPLRPIVIFCVLRRRYVGNCFVSSSEWSPGVFAINWRRMTLGFFSPRKLESPKILGNHHFEMRLWRLDDCCGKLEL